MKRISDKLYQYTRRKQIRTQCKLKKEARARNHRKSAIFVLEKNEQYRLSQYRRKRHNFSKNLYKKFKYDGKPIDVVIDQPFGLEDKNEYKYFLEKSSEFIDTSSKHITFDVTECERVWPSAVTLMCSLVEWSEVSFIYNGRNGFQPKIKSTKSNNDGVNSYLKHCGYDKYIDFEDDALNNHYNNDDIVKVRRELKKTNIEEREDEIIELIGNYCNYNEDDLERINSYILTEIFNNVTEHGYSHKDKGWWILAQHHEKHELISLCIADNGIGIKNTLLTGPQRKHIKRTIGDTKGSDGKYLRLATHENVSGAITASIKEQRIFLDQYKRGARRGNGLKRIKETCNNLKIGLAILSHNGVLIFDNDGKELDCDTYSKRVFAGTLYHLTIPSKGYESENN